MLELEKIKKKKEGIIYEIYRLENYYNDIYSLENYQNNLKMIFMLMSRKFQVLVLMRN